ncbi:putative mitochondrial inner membrane protease subunit 2 protein [Neofusicoccum parvum]|uniref:Mitochondrial inner membrane protease subunit 2 protein n=1 Tax=Neofusicoccum parvum TaxID=310453 RepID=A0ACB5SLS6_9PEZI|nr:putative mitochondrial inner membrane protease subunit 2 protein [Neofusicoccum parvum]
MAPPLLSRLPRTARFALRYGYYTAVGLSALAFTRSCIVEVTGVEGKSMAPTLSPHFDEAGEMDKLLFNRLAPPQLLRRGDIVSFWAPHKPEQLSVKRVVALPGDVVITRGRYPFKKLVVPYSHVWVEGDNWRHTVDSNDFGPRLHDCMGDLEFVRLLLTLSLVMQIPMGLINGRAEYIVWPPSRIGKVPDPKVEFKTYSKVIPAKFPMKPPRELID